MPRGPKGEKRPADVIANAVRVMEIATGQREDVAPNKGRMTAGKRGAAARSAALDPERRTAIAKAAAKKRWHTAE